VPQIVIRLGVLELEMFSEQYDALVADLKAEGYDVELVDEITEQRSGIPDPDTLYGIVVEVRESPEYKVVLATLLNLIGKHLHGKAGKRKREGRVVYLPDGKVHRFDVRVDD
jgi:hypothetical protein